MPGSLEAYYQEAGRAGRDGDAAECLLLHGRADLVTQHMLARGASHAAHREALIAAVDTWARARACRQVGIADYFGSAETEPCGRCDFCSGELEPEPVVSAPRAAPPAVRAAVRSELDVIVEAARQLRRPVGKVALARALRGSRAKALRRSGLLDTPVHGRLHAMAESDVVAAIEQLLASGELERKGKKYPTVWLAGRPVRSTVPRPDTTRRKPRHTPLWRALDSYRRRTARKLRWKVYMVFSTAVVDAIDAARPDSLWALGELQGIGPSKLDRFGADVLALVKEHAGD
jgi:ATP-dependent DNA helicase RecQ